MLSWENITVQQFQDVYKLTINGSADEMEKLEKTVAILFDKSEQEIAEMSMNEFSAAARECTFILNMSKIPGKPVKQFIVNGRKYAIEYNPKKLMSTMRHRQYVETLHFGDKMIDNMHYVMASLVQRVKFGFIKQKNTAANHAAFAGDMLQARVIDVYHTCVFFCKLFVALMQATKGCLGAEMKKKGATKEEIQLVEQTLQSAMAGFTVHLQLPNWKG